MLFQVQILQMTGHWLKSGEAVALHDMADAYAHRIATRYHTATRVVTVTDPDFLDLPHLVGKVDTAYKPGGERDDGMIDWIAFGTKYGDCTVNPSGSIVRKWVAAVSRWIVSTYDAEVIDGANKARHEG